MSLKSLIQWLLDSRTTPAQAAHNASSTFAEPTYFNGTPTAGDNWTGNLYTGTAPTDGYLNVSCTTNINMANAGAMVQAQIGGAQISQVSPLSGQGFNMMAPISKGATFSVSGIRLSDITVRFFKAIGGGYNHFVRRALSCLRPSFNFLQRSFCKANPNGSAIKLCQTIQPSGLFTHLKAHPVNTSHRLTGMSLFTPVAMNGRKSGMETEVSLFQQKVQLTSAFKWLSQRVLKSGTSFKSPWLMVLKKRSLSLFQQSERDALTGGALC